MLGSTLASAYRPPRRALELHFFGDSLAMPEDTSHPERSTPLRTYLTLTKMLRERGVAEAADVRMTGLVYSGFSQWTLYYLVDRIITLQPDLVIVEFNLYNFGSFWRHRDRKIVAAMLTPRRVLEVSQLPTFETGLTVDDWLFHHVLLREGWLPTWSAVQSEQARLASAYWVSSDAFQRRTGLPPLSMRQQAANLAVASRDLPNQNRATKGFAQRLMDKALAGVTRDDAAIQMLEASLRRLTAAGLPVLVYVPPYNIDHLNSLGLMESSHLEESIETVAAAAKDHGADFLDLHRLLPDSAFRDSMDHLVESETGGGQQEVGNKIADAITPRVLRILQEKGR